MKTVVIRERIDWTDGQGYKHGAMHKEWSDGTIEYYTLNQDSSYVDISKADWERLADDHKAKSVWPNSDWGSGLTEEQETEFRGSGMGIDDWLRVKNVTF